MGLFDGTPSSSNLTGFTPWMKPPGYDFSSKLYDYMSGMIGQPAPQYGGWGRMAGAAGANSGGRYLKKMSGLADRYMETGMPTIFGQATGALSKFLNPSFMNPMARTQMGAPQMIGNPFGPGLQGGNTPQGYPQDRGANMGGGSIFDSMSPMMRGRMRFPMPGGFEMPPPPPPQMNQGMPLYQ